MAHDIMLDPTFACFDIFQYVRCEVARVVVSELAWKYELGPHRALSQIIVHCPYQYHQCIHGRIVLSIPPPPSCVLNMLFKI